MSISSSAYRPQEILTAQIAEAMVRELSDDRHGPVTGLPLAFAVQTGDNSDNSQYNEIRWNIDLLDGGRCAPTPATSRVRRRAWTTTGVLRHLLLAPARDARRARSRTPRARRTASRRFRGCSTPRASRSRRRGLGMPWFTAIGNHDELVQGNFRAHGQPAGQGQSARRSRATRRVQRTVTADPDRRLLSRAEWSRSTSRRPAPRRATASPTRTAPTGTAYYTFDQGLVRFIVMDTVNRTAARHGSLDQTQFAWLQEQLAAAGDRLVIARQPPHVLDDEQRRRTGQLDASWATRSCDLLLAHENVVAWVNGHTHPTTSGRTSAPRAVAASGRSTPPRTSTGPSSPACSSSPTTSDGTLSIFATMVDHGAPLRPGTLGGPMQLAALGRAAGRQRLAGPRREPARPRRERPQRRAAACRRRASWL